MSNCVPNFCLLTEVHPKIWEQPGNIKSPLPFLAVLLRSLMLPQVLAIPGQGALFGQPSCFAALDYDETGSENSVARTVLIGPPVRTVCSPLNVLGECSLSVPPSFGEPPRS